jgi:hypothetical protein
VNPAYCSQEAFEAWIPNAFREMLGGEFNAAVDALSRRDSKALSAIENRVNALKTPAKDLDQAVARVLPRGQGAGDEREEQAGKLLCSSACVPHFLFSGAATRLGLGSVYFLDPSQFGLCLLGKACALTETQQATVRKNLAEMPEPGQKSLLAAVSQWAERNKAPRRLGLGPRQLLEYRSLLPKDASPLAVMHLPESEADEVLEDLVKNKFYGFPRDGIYFLIQPACRGYVFRGRGIGQDPASPALPAGHGYALMQLFQDGAAFQADGKGKRLLLEGSVYDALAAKGAQVMASHRVNDLTQITPVVADPKRLSAALALMEDIEDPGTGSNVVVELVANPENQKGGFWKLDKRTGRKALAETLNLKTPELDAFVSKLQSPPYNAFRNVYKFSALGRIVREEGLTPFLRFRGGRMYPETVTGEATELEGMRAEAFRVEDELIHDFKELKNLPEALDFVSEQDRRLKWPQ